MQSREADIIIGEAQSVKRGQSLRSRDGFRPGRAAFSYAGSATFWDPPDADRAEMREIARKVGAHLRARVGYRGALR